MFFWCVILILLFNTAYLYEKQRSQKMILTNLIEQLNSLNLESSNTAWISNQNKNDILLIKDALSISRGGLHDQF